RPNLKRSLQGRITEPKIAHDSVSCSSEHERPRTGDLRQGEMGEMELTHQYFDAIKNSQHVEVKSIPLPNMPQAPSNTLIQDIELPSVQPPSFLKTTSVYSGSKMKTGNITQNVFNRIMMMIFPMSMKIMAILRTWIKIYEDSNKDSNNDRSNKKK
ncbi:WW domain-binding protein 11, partial [Galemys pyrenaicus]